MYVGSYFELHTALLAWSVYTLLFNVLIITGLAYVPFLMLLYRNWKEPGTQAENRPSVGVSLKRMYVDLISVLFVFTIFFLPLWDLSPKQVVFSPGPSAIRQETVSTNTDPTTYKDTFKNIEGFPAKISPGWAFVAAVSGGLTNAVTHSLPSTGDLAAAEAIMTAGAVHSPILATEISNFATECFGPARARYFQLLREGKLPQKAIDYVEEHPTDLNWLGSRVLLDTPGLYKPRKRGAYAGAMRAEKPVAGWPAEPGGRDWWYGEAEAKAGTPGRPYCDEWWTDPDKGIRSKLVEIYKKNSGAFDKGYDYLSARITTINTDLTVDDYLAKVAIDRYSRKRNTITDYAHRRTASGFGSTVQANLNSFKNLAGAVGASYTAGKFSFYLHVILQALPYIQATILMGIVMMLPVYLVFSGYSLEAVFYFAVAFFTVRFWTALWEIAAWAEKALTDAMFPTGADMLNALASGISSLVTLGGNGSLDVGTQMITKIALVNLVTASLYLGLPFVWSVLMGMAGMRFGNKLTTSAVNSSGGEKAEEAGKSSTSAAGKVVGAGSKGIKGGTKM